MSVPVPITAAQLEALQKVRDILQEAGLLISPPSSPQSELTRFKALLTSSIINNSIISSRIKYIPPSVTLYTAEEILAGRNRTTSQGYTQKFICHPENVIVEYPETGNLSSKAVAHIFPYWPDEQEDFDPKLNIQYGIWGKHGSRRNVCLFLLSEGEEKPFTISHQFKAECMGVKKCAYTGILPTLSVNVQHPSSGSMGKFVDSAQHEVFMKTLGFFCALMQNGCLFNPEVEEEDEEDEDEEDTPESALLFYESLSDIQSRNPGDIQKCDGKLQQLWILKKRLEEKDMDLSFPVILSLLQGSKRNCVIIVNFHHTKEGILKRGHKSLDSDDLPQSSLHSDPRATRTPKPIEDIFMTLLDTLGWRLANATPRKIILDSAFMIGLRKALNWNGLQDPSLSDLHPSLGNVDHVARVINKLRLDRFPNGTGFEGILTIVEENSLLPPDQVYVRSAEKIDIPGEGSFSLIIYMFKTMKFEIEAWFPEYSRSVVIAHAFTTSQSAKTHKVLFQRIFAIVEADTGQQVQFQHIHRTGWDTIITDEHRGQALGLGLCLQDICRNTSGYCSVDWTKPLHVLTPYDHTKRCLRICFQHYTTRVHNLKLHVSSPVYRAMMSLYSADPIHNYEAMIALIAAGGKKASDWLKDKRSAENSILAAIYRPLSKIPVEAWKASPNTTNGNEQSH
ncbi:hypothetical protein M422DRAFT_248459 [Sphaerobolus stellatus SS14]|uniref:Uncharacterized protein n=1 Tax=Sphaerobolus stellatus (strain SS14) TaxID=990650 RepID=A0A0C9UW19_SPHS4|nr:hypothetical protein M422DRAFT_248459 [Sphaerobolus stellatus SS14]